MSEDGSKQEAGYRVEYIAPTSVHEELLEIFRNIQKGLSSTELHNIIEETPQNIKDKGSNTYLYMIPFKNNKGYILFEYWDMVAEMESFEEFMHSERGRLETSVFWQVPRLRSFNYIQLNGGLSENYSYKDKNDYGELVWDDSEYIWLTGPGSINIKSICDQILEVWNHFQQIEIDAQELPKINL